MRGDGPVRLQRKRTKGWRMPEGAVYVGRPTIWGNPWYLDGASEHAVSLRLGPGWKAESVARGNGGLAFVVAHHRLWLKGGTALALPEMVKWRMEVCRRLKELRGKDLVCWCSLDRACHADTLIDLANTPAGLLEEIADLGHCGGSRA